MEHFNEPTHNKDEVLHLCWRQYNYSYRIATKVHNENVNKKANKQTNKTEKQAVYWIIIEIMPSFMRGSSNPAVIMLHGTLIL